MKLLVAIPVYNERKYVGHVLDKIRQFHSDLLIIDDGSTDGTGEYLAGRKDLNLVRHPQNLGYGQSLIDAFAYSDTHQYDWVITMDCDEQHEPEMIPTFVRHILTDDVDVISGSRYKRAHDNDDAPPGDRRHINTFLTKTINNAFGWRLTDTFCGYKAHRVAGNRLLTLSERGYAFPMQLWPQIFKAGLRLRKFPSAAFTTILPDILAASWMMRTIACGIISMCFVAKQSTLARLTRPSPLRPVASNLYMIDASLPTYADWKAPGGDGQVLLWPEPARILSEARSNHEQLSAESSAIQGVPLGDLRRLARAWIGHADDNALLLRPAISVSSSIRASGSRMC